MERNLNKEILNGQEDLKRSKTAHDLVCDDSNYHMQAAVKAAKKFERDHFHAVMKSAREKECKRELKDMEIIATLTNKSTVSSTH